MHFSVIDKIIACQPGALIRAEKLLHRDEPFLRDHFPGTPVLPGVLILEAMTQAGDRLIQDARREPPGKFRLQKLRAVKFVHFVQPGETLTVSVKLVEENADHAEVACEAAVGDRLVTSARMTLASRDASTLNRHAPSDEVAPNADSEFRWLWLDRFVEFQVGRSARALKRVPHTRPPYSSGRLYPEQLTAALVLEGLAQTGGLLAFDALSFRKSPIMAKITKAEFHGEPEPGTVLEYSAVLERLDEDVAMVSVSSHCGDKLHAQAQILFAFMADASGGSTVDPAIFYTMLLDAGAFDVPPQRRLWAMREPQLKL
jgi:3-hydroxyacyl-[acyl-carrier-protein] dehydratase